MINAKIPKVEKEKPKKQKETIYESRWIDNRLPPKDRRQKAGHQTWGQAEMDAIVKSERFGYCEIAEVEITWIGEATDETIKRLRAYLGGDEIEHGTDEAYAMKRDAAIKAAVKKLEKLETETKENKMKIIPTAAFAPSDVTSAEVSKATKGKVVTKVTPAAAKNAGKGAVAAAAKAQKAGKAGKGKAKAAKKAEATPKAPKAPVGKPGSLLASLGLREGSKKAAIFQLLTENVGKMLAVKDILKAGYGSQNIENIGALRMVLAGGEENMRRNSVGHYLARGEDAKGDLTLGLKKGKAPAKDA